MTGRTSQPLGPRARWVLPVVAALALLGPATAAAQSDGSAQPRIVGGTTTPISKYPWQAAVVRSARFSGNAHQRQFCGGSVITSRIVITAGHCVFNTDPDCSLGICLGDPGGDGSVRLDPNDVDVVLGRSKLSNGGEGAELGVQQVSLRANYFDDGVPHNDVAYLVLGSPTGQPPIHIADPSEGGLWDPGSPVEISGWGSTSESGSTVDDLRWASVQIIDDGTCSSDYGSLFNPSVMVCAGFQSGGVDTCSGDSGGPLEAPVGGGAYRLVGLTGWGVGCARNRKPGVYTRVAGPALLALIQSDVCGLESANGFAHEVIVGGTSSCAVPAGAVAVKQNPFRKCKKIKNKRKRKRCIKKVKRKLANS